MARHQKWDTGDIFILQNADGLWSVGQVIAREREILNSVCCAFFGHRIKGEGGRLDVDSLLLDDPFSILLVTRDLLDRGVWLVVGNLPVRVGVEQIPYKRFRATQFVGAKVTGSAIVSEFVNAYFGLVAWDDWKDPAYLDSLLLSPEKKPKNLILRRSCDSHG